MVGPSDLVGVAGSILIVGTYALSQAGRMDVHRPLYPALNALGAALVVASLMVTFNLGAFIVEAFWCVISLAGLVRAVRRRPGAAPDAAGESGLEAWRVDER